MKIIILDRAALGADTPVESLSALGDLEIYESSTPEETLCRVQNAEVLILNKVKITANVLESAKKLKLICVFATGYDNIDVKRAAELGVAVCNVPGYSSTSVALHTVALVTSLATHLTEYSRFVRTGEYTASGVPNKLVPVYHELAGKNWGVIGYGGIGKAVARIAEAFGANVLVNKRTYVSGVNVVDLETLARESDVISIHCPLTDRTRGIINRELISKMKRDIIIVNEARGAVVNERDIADAIKEEKIGAFGCDVYSVEPFGSDHPFNEIMDRDNVILTPHCAWGAYESRARCMSIIVDNIKSFYEGKMLNRVDI